jgi:hypothetical protein
MLDPLSSLLAALKEQSPENFAKLAAIVGFETSLPQE